MVASFVRTSLCFVLLRMFTAKYLHPEPFDFAQDKLRELSFAQAEVEGCENKAQASKQFDRY